MSIYQKTLTHFGIYHQMGKTIEEFSEASAELSKVLVNEKEANTEKLCEELADAAIMIEQMKIAFPQIEEWKVKKLERLEVMLDE